MLFETPVIDGPIGFKPAVESAVCFNRTGGTLAIGEAVALDINGSQNEVVASGLSPHWTADSRWANVVSSTPSNNIDHGQWGIVLKGGADNAEVLVALCGEVKALVKKNSGNIAEGDPLIAVGASKFLNADIGSANRIIAKCLENVTAPSTATLATVLFEGRWRGFGIS